MKTSANAFGERPVLKLMYASLLRASEPWRGLKISVFEMKQLEMTGRDGRHGTSVAPIEVLGVDTVEVSHGPCQVGLRRLDEQVVVVAHQHVGMQHQVVVRDDGGQPSQKGLAVPPVAVDRLARVATRRDVVAGAREADPQWAGHPAEVSTT